VSYFLDIPIKNVSDGITATKSNISSEEIEIEVEFEDEFKTGKTVELGYHSINYTSGDNLITIVGDAFCGENVTDACNFQDIYDTDLANNTWNCTTSNQNATGYLLNTSFTINCKIQVGDGTTETWFADDQVQVTFIDILTANFQIFIERKANGNIVFGTLEDATRKSTSGGIQFNILQDSYQIYVIYDASSTGSTNVYSSSFISQVLTWIRVSNGKMYNNILTYNTQIYGRSNTDYFNNYIGKASYGIWSIAGTWDKVEIMECDSAFFVEYSPVTMSNLYARGSGQLARVKNLGGNIFLVNPDSDVWNYTWVGTSVGEIYRQYEFDLNVTYTNGTAINDTTVNINSSIDDTNCFNNATTTNSLGSIETQTITAGYYNFTGGNTIYDCNPYNFYITKSGYETLNFTANITEKTEWFLSMGRGNGLGYETAVVIGSVFVASMFFYLMVKLREDHKILQSFFLFVGMSFIMLTMSLSRSVAESGGASTQTITLLDTGTVITTWVFWITMAYFMIMLLITAFGLLLNYKKKKW